MAAFPHYERYKQSGIPWIQKVPEHWIIERGKWLFTKAERPVRPDDEVVTAFRDGQVTLRANRRTEGFTNAIQEHGYQGIRKGDLVIHAMDAFAGAIGVSDSDGKATPVYSACVPSGEYSVNPHYYAYLLRYMSRSGYIQALAKGIRERSTDFRFNDFSGLFLPIPSREEQDRIVNFLDQKTAAIDEAIAKKQRLIELLKEQKAILINQAVTKGLNPDAPMRDSGVEWIGGIPAHWEIVQFRRATASICDGPFGSSLTSSHYSSTGARVVRLQNIGSSEFIDNDRAYIPMKHFELLKRHSVVKGDLLLAALGDENKPVGRGCVYPGCDAAAIVKADCFRVRLMSSFSGEYVAAFMSSRAGAIGALAHSRGTTRARINLEIAKSLPLPKPPLQEQETIATRVGEIATAFSQAEDKIAGDIATIEEFKRTIVEQVVTGKIRI